jgi:hypothetical protein
MKLKLLKWIYHGKSKKKRLPIFSVDIQPFGDLLLTTGGDCVLKIWEIKKNLNFNANIKKLNKNYKKKYSKQEPLVILENHKNIINIVRWTVDGKKFASGSDDGYLLIYENTQNPIIKFLWKIYHKFQCYTGDIVDIAWCINCELIASASLDNSVIIWSLENKSILIQLLGHRGWVKGISWDPTSRFIVTQSDDKNIIIWKTNFWKLFKKIKIKKKFKLTQCEIQNDFFSRSNWSSCGRYLFICNSCFNYKRSSIFVLDRLNKFKKKIYVTGFDFLTRIIRCSLRIYNNKIKNILKSYFSFGTAEGIFNIFSTDTLKSHIYIKYLTNNQILDISWGSCGYDLICCSLHGHVFYLKFSIEELGKILKLKEHTIFVKQYYLILNKFTLNNIYNFFLKSKPDNEKLEKFFKINFKILKISNIKNKQRIKTLLTKEFIFSNQIIIKSNLKNCNYIYHKKIHSNRQTFFTTFECNNFFIIRVGLKKIIFNIILKLYYKLDEYVILLQTGKNEHIEYYLFLKNNKFLIKIFLIKSKKNYQIKFFSKLSFIFSYKIYLIVSDCFANVFIINTNKMTKIIFRKVLVNLIFFFEDCFFFYKKIKRFLYLYVCSGLIKSNFLIFF